MERGKRIHIDNSRGWPHLRSARWFGGFKVDLLGSMHSYSTLLTQGTMLPLPKWLQFSPYFYKAGANTFPFRRYQDRARILKHTGLRDIDLSFSKRHLVIRFCPIPGYPD